MGVGSVRQPVCPAAAAAKGGDARQRRFVRCAAVQTALSAATAGMAGFVPQAV
ncbi:hypothetical protein [Neisseria musculi]|uniref:hypothetical protein n=1 Tax=Neisseria musculi TaxID=1815583 RepID=UPI00164C01E3|nr:hypothetical protein [Neisseria musculi]